MTSHGHNTKPQTPFCKFLISGSCTKGKDCRFRHHGPERPLATAYACEVFGPTFQRAADPLIDHDVPKGSYTQIFNSGVKATFADGVLPSHIVFMEDLRATSTVSLLNCKGIEQTDQVFRALQGTMLHGVQLKCLRQTTQKKNHWTVEVINATESISSEDVMALLPQGLPKAVRTKSGPPSYEPFTPALDLIAEKIASKTNKPVTGKAMTDIRNKTKFKAEIEFDGSPNLSILARSLCEEPIAELGKSEMYANERLQIVLRVDMSSYKRHASRLKKLAGDTWRYHKVAIHIDEGDASTTGSLAHPSSAESHRQPVEITLRGTNREAVTSAKITIDKTMSVDLKEDLLRRQKLPPVPTHRIRLTKAKAYRSAIKGGFERAVKVVGNSVLVLDDESDPPAILVRGDTGVLRKVQGIIFSNGDAASDASITCSVCWNNLDDAVHMPKCNHVCCKDCFVEYCTMERDAKFPLRCCETGCETLIPMLLLRTELCEQEMLDVVGQAAKDHFDRHPEQFAQCPGFGCDAYYRTNAVDETSNSTADAQRTAVIAETSREKTCPTCFTVVCVHCKVEQHVGETCPEFQYRVSGHQRLLEQWMKDGKAKRCKRCKTVVEKVEGCNNIECPGCHWHFCWVCLEVFPRHGDVYGHLADVHGGWFDRPEDGIAPEDVLYEEYLGLRPDIVGLLPPPRGGR